MPAKATPKTARRDRGEGGLRQRPDGLWEGTVDLGYGGDGKRRRKYVYSKDYKKAVAKLRAARRQAEDTAGAMPTAGQTVESWLRHWLDDIAAPRLKPRALQGYRTAVHRHLIPHIGARRLTALQPQHVRDLHRALEQVPLAAGTILKAHRVLAKALTDAQREGRVARNVATLVDAPRKSTADQQVLTVEDALTLLRATRGTPAGSRWGAALFLGARQGECLGLEWDRVDLDDGVADLSWQLQRLGYVHGCQTGRPADGEPWACGRRFAGDCPTARLEVPAGFEHRVLHGALCLTRPKSRAGRRVVVLPRPLLDLLREHRAATTGDGLVWTTSDGRPIDPRADYQAWVDTLAKLKLPPVKLHAARHTTATLLLAAGVDAEVIRSILGHSAVVTTRGYQHVDRTLQTRAAEKLGQALALD
ncbi:MAG: tyrosine-type recombinase/integrase [Actinomycetes bacterium]